MRLPWTTVCASEQHCDLQFNYPESGFQTSICGSKFVEFIEIVLIHELYDTKFDKVNKVGLSTLYELILWTSPYEANIIKTSMNFKVWKPILSNWSGLSIRMSSLDLLEGLLELNESSDFRSSECEIILIMCLDLHLLSVSSSYWVTLPFERLLKQKGRRFCAHRRRIAFGL